MPFPSLTRAQAYAVHLLTASGVVAAFLAVAELFDDAPDERVVFAWLIVAVVIDAVDGPLARAWDVKRFAPDIDGRTIDDIVDYLTFTFIPLLLVWRMGWVPSAPGLLGAVWIVPALLASLLGFANVGAKDEAAGVLPRLSELLEHRCVLRRPGVPRPGRDGTVVQRRRLVGARGTDRLAGAVPLP
jgi:phosphatidylserine synthase